MDDESNVMLKKIELLEKALGREQKARQQAEDLLESRASALFLVNQKLLSEYKAAARRSAENEFLLQILGLAGNSQELSKIYEKFLEKVCLLVKWPIGMFMKLKIAILGSN